MREKKVYVTSWRTNLAETNAARRSMLPRVEGVETRLELLLVTKREFITSAVSLLVQPLTLSI
jgi:hypothetical protein